jgi:hypothetical protein
VAVPAVAMSGAVICAVSCVGLTYVVLWLVPFHCTIEPGVKPLPLTVNVKAAPAALTDEGESDELVGVGSDRVKPISEDVPPPGVGVTTATVTFPVMEMSAALIDAVSCVALT